MADSNWEYNLNNYKPTNFSVNDWVNELKTKADQAYEGITPKDTSSSLLSADIRKADELAKQDIANRKAAYQSQYGIRAYEQEYRDIQKKAKEAVDKYGYNLGSTAYNPNYANDDLAKEYRNNPNFKKEYEKLINQSGRSYDAEDIARNEDLYGSHGYTVDQAKQIHDNPLMTALKGAAQGLGNGIVSTLTGIARVPEEINNYFDTKDLIADGTANRVAELKSKEQERTELQNELKVARDSGDTDRAEFLAGVLSSPDMQMSDDDQKFLNSPQYQKFQQVDSINQSLQQDIQATQNTFGKSAYQARKEMLEASTARKDLQPSTIGMDFIKTAKANYSDPNGLVAEIMSSIPLSVISAGPLGLGTMLDGAFSTMSDLWQKNKNNPDVTARLSPHDFNRACMEALAGSIMDWCGDTIIGNTGKQIMKFGPRTLRSDIERTLRDTLETVETQFPNLSADEQRKLAGNLIAIRSQQITNDAILHGHGPADSIVQRAQEGTAAINGNLLQSIAGGAATTSNTLKNTFRSAVSGISNKIKDFNEKYLGNARVNGTLDTTSNLLDTMANNTNRMTKLARIVAPIAKPTTVIGNYAKELGKESLGEAVSNLGAEYYNKKAEATYENDKSKEMTAAEGAKAAGEGLAQGTAMGAVMMGGAHAGYYAKKALTKGKTDITNDSTFNGVYKSLKEASDKTEESAAIGDTINSLTKQLNKSSEDAKKHLSTSLDALLKASNIAGSIETISSDLFPDVRLINTESKANKDLIANADSATQKLYRQVVKEQNEALDLIDSNRDKKDKLISLQDNIMKHTVASIRGLEGNDRVRQMHGQTFLKNYSLADDNDKAELQAKFESAYADNILQEKNTSATQEDAEHMAHSVFTEMTGDQKVFNKLIDTELENNPQNIIGSKAYNIVDNVVKQKFKNSSNKTGSEEDYKKYRLARIANVLHNHAITGDYITRLNQYDNAGDKLISALANKDSGNFKKARQDFSEFTDAMNKHGKTTELDYLADMYGQAGYDFKSYSGKFSKGFKQSIKDKIPGTEKKRDTYYVNAMDSKNADVLMDAMAKAVNADTESLDEDEYQKLVAKGNKNPGLLSEEELNNLRSNAYLRGDITGLNIYYQKKGLSNEQVNQEFKDISARIDPVFQALKSSETILDQVSDNQIKELSATGSDGKKRLQDSLKKYHMDAVFVVQDITPNESDESKKTYGIVPINYAVFAPVMEFVQRMKSLRFNKISFTKDNILEAYGNMAKYYIDHKDELKSKHTFDTKDNDLDYIINNIFGANYSVFGLSTRAGVVYRNLSTEDALQLTYDAISYVTGKPAAVNKYGAFINSHPNIASQTSFKSNEEMVALIVAGLNDYSEEQLNQSERRAGLALIKYVDGLDDLIDAINFGKQTRNIIQNRDFKSIGTSIGRATKVNMSRFTREMRHTLTGYRQEQEKAEEKNKEKFDKSVKQLSSKLGESTQELIENSQELMESKDPQDQARAVEVAKTIQQRVVNVAGNILYTIGKLEAIDGITRDNIHISQNDLNNLLEYQKNAERSVNLVRGRLNNKQPNEATNLLQDELSKLETSRKIISGLIGYLTRRPNANPLVANDDPLRTKGFIESLQDADLTKDSKIYNLISADGTTQIKHVSTEDILINTHGNIRFVNQTNNQTYNFGDIRNELEQYDNNRTILDNNIYDDNLYVADSADLVSELSNYRRLMHNRNFAPRIAQFLQDIASQQARSITGSILRDIYNDAKASDKYGAKGTNFDQWVQNVTTVNNHRVTPDLEQLVTDNFATIIAKIQNIATQPFAGSNGVGVYDYFVQSLFNNRNLSINDIREDFKNFNFSRFSGNNSVLLSIFANDPIIKQTINNPQYPNQIRHFIDIVNKLSYIRDKSRQAYYTVGRGISQTQRTQLENLVNNNIFPNINGRYLNGSLEVRNQVINTANGNALNLNELTYVRNYIDYQRAVAALTNISTVSGNLNHQISLQTEFNEGGQVNRALRAGLDVITSIAPADTLNAPIPINPDAYMSKHSTEDIYKKIFDIVADFQNRLQNNANHDSYINDLKRAIKTEGYTDDNIINQVIDNSYNTNLNRPDFIKRITTKDSKEFIRAFFRGITRYNQGKTDYALQIYTSRAADNTNVRNTRVTGTHTNQVNVAFDNGNDIGRFIFDHFINNANLNDTLVIDEHKFTNAFLHCDSASSITNSILATNAEWAGDFAEFSKSTEELAHMFGRISNDSYINSKYGAGDLVDRLFIKRNDVKVGIESLQAACIQAAINGTFSANKLEASQDEEHLDKFVNLDAAARAKLLTLQGVNRDELLNTITSDIKKLLPFVKNTGNEQLAEGFAVRALQLLEHEHYIKLNFVNIKTGEVHDSSSNMSNQNCVCLVTFDEKNKDKYDQMKNQVNRITKWNQIYHIDYFERVYGSRTPTNLEAVDHAGYLNNQERWSNQSTNTLRNLSEYRDNNGHSTNVTNDAHFDDFIKTYKDDEDRVYVYNALLNALSADPNLVTGDAINRLYNGTLQLTRHVNYFEDNSTNFTFDATQFRNHMNNICYLAIGADNSGHKASVGIINQNFVDRESRAIFNQQSGTKKNPFVFIDGDNLYSDIKSGIFAPDANILSIANLDSKPSGFNVYSGLDNLKLFTDAGYSLNQLTNNEVDNILIDLYNHVNDLKSNTHTPADYENSPHYKLYTALGLDDIKGVGEYAETTRSKVKTAISDKLKEINFLLGIRLFEHDANQNTDQTFYDYLTDNNATQQDIQDRLNNLVTAYTDSSVRPDNKLYINTTLNNKKVKLTQWHLAYFYHRVTPNNRLYTCGSLMSDRETKGNRCVWSTALSYPANVDDDIEFSTALDQTKLMNIFTGRDRHGHDDPTLSGISSLLAVLSANLGLSVDKVFRVNYWRNIDHDGKNWSLGSNLTDLLLDKRFTDEIKYAADHNGTLRVITDKDGKIKLAIDDVLEGYKVATVNTEGRLTTVINDNKFYKKFSFTGGDWTENANSIPILNNFIEMYRANPNIFTDMGNMLNTYRNHVLQHTNSNDQIYRFTNTELINLRNNITSHYRNAFNNVYFRFVHEGDGLTSGPGLSNGQFNDITAFELLRNTSANDPRYSLFNMTGIKTREFFDRLRSDAAFAAQVAKDPDVALDIYLATAQDTSMIFHTYFREAIVNLTSNNDKRAGEKLLALLSLFADGYGMPMYGNTQDVGHLLNPDVTRNMMKPFMTQYVYGSGMKSLAVKADELAYKQWNDQIQGANYSYTLDNFLNQLLILSNNNTFVIQIAANPNNNPWSDTHIKKVTVTKKDGKLYFDGATRDDVQKCWDKKRVSISFRDNTTNGANEFIKGTLGVAISKATDKVLGITRVHNRPIAQAGSIVSAITEIGLVTKIRSIYKTRRELGEVRFTREDRDKIEQYAYDILNVKVGVSAGLAGGELKAQIKRDIKPRIEQLLNDIEGYTISTFYPGVDGTTGLAGVAGGKLPQGKSPALTPEANHTIDSYIASAAHNVINDLHFRDVFDAMITSADSFNETMKAANQAHMGMMYVQNAKFYIAQSVRNAINVFNTQIKSDLGSTPEAQEFVASTFSEFGMTDINQNIADLGLNKYADELQVQAVQDDLNRISQLESILNGNVKNLYSNGYFGTVEGTSVLVQNGQIDPQMRGRIVSMIKFLCERNNITYTENNGVRTYSNGINTNGNLNYHTTGMNVRIFNTLIENNQDTDYKKALEALCDSTRNQNQEFTLKSNIFDMKILNQKASIEDLINAVRQTQPANAARAVAAIEKAARAVINRDSEFVDTALETLNAMNDMLHNVQSRSIRNGVIDEDLQNRNLFTQTVKSFNDWDANQNKTRSELYSAITGALQEQFDLGQIIGPDLKKITDAVFARLANKDIKTVTKTQILLEIDNTQNNINTVDANYNQKLNLLNAACQGTSITFNDNLDNNVYNVLSNAKSGSNVFIHKDTDIAWDNLRENQIVESSILSNVPSSSATTFIHNFIDNKLKDKYGKTLRDQDIVLVEGHNTTDLLVYIRLKHLQNIGEINKNAKIIYTRDLQADHSQTGSLRTQDAIVANLLLSQKQDERPLVQSVVFSYLSDNVDSDLVDSIAFWGNPKLIRPNSHRSWESFAVPDADLRGRKLKHLSLSETELGNEIKNTVRSRNKIYSKNFIQIDTRYDRDIISNTSDDYDRSNSRIDISYIARTLAGEFYNDMDATSVAAQRLINVVNNSTVNFSPATWLQLTAKSPMLTNAGFNSNTVDQLAKLLTTDHSTNEPIDINILRFGEFTENVNKGDVVGIPVSISSDGKLYLPQNNNFCFQLINALGGKKVLRDIEQQWNQRQNTNQEFDPIFTMPVTFRNVRTGDIVTTQIQFINLNNNLIPRTELTQYMYQTPDGVHKWDYGKLIQTYKISGKLPSAEDIYSGRNAVDGAGNKIGQSSDGFYQLPLIPKDFDLNNPIHTNAMSSTGARSYMDYIKAHLAKVLGGKDFGGVYHLLGETLNIYKNNPSNTINNNIRQYTVNGSISMEKAKEWNTLPIGQSDAAQREVSIAMEKGNKLSGITNPYDRSRHFNGIFHYSWSSDLDKYINQAMYYEAEQSADQYTDTIRKWIAEDSKNITDDLSYLNDIADMLGNSQFKMHIKLIDHPDAMAGASAIDMNNIDNHMDAAVVVSTRRDMARRPGLSKAEMLVHEIAHNHFRLMTPHQYMEATKLYNVASKYLTPKALEDAGATKTEAEDIYKYIFQNANVDSVHEFLAYALTNRYVIRALNNSALNDKLAVALRSRTVGLARKAISFITGSHGIANEPNVAVTKVRDLFNTCIMATHDWDKVRKNVYRYNSNEKIRQEYTTVINKEASNFKQGLFHSIDSQLKGLPNWDKSMGQVFDAIDVLKDGFAKDITKELEGTSNNSLIYAKCAYKYRSQLDSAKGVSIGAMKDIINNLLNTYGIKNYETKLRKNLSEVVMRLDLGSLSKEYDADEVIKFLKPDNKERTNEIARLEKTINNPWMLNKANELADYLITGTSKSGIRYTNAYQIASMYGTPKAKSVGIDSDIYKNLDIYVTLKAIDNMIHSNLKDNPITDSENGVLTVLDRESVTDDDGNTQKGDALLKHLMAVQEGLKYNEIHKVWGNSIDAYRNMPKGYIFPNSQSDCRVRLIEASDIDRWNTIGYSRISDPVTINGHQMIWIGTKHHAFAPEIAGLFSKAAKNFVHGKTNQVNVYGEDFMYGQLSQNEQADMFIKVLEQVKNSTFKSFAGSNTNLVPRFDNAGNIAAFDIEMNNQKKEEYMGSDLDISSSMANIAGMITERSVTPQTNQETTKALLDYYNENKTSKKWTWVNENHEMWKFLPDTVKQEVTDNPDLHGKGFPVETKYLDRVFGKERFTFANWSEKKLIQGFAEESFVDHFNWFMNNPLGLKLEGAIQKTAQWGKNLIVVKNLVPSVTNVMSNVGTLCACENMTVKQTVKYMKDGYTCIQDYLDCLRKKEELETDLAVWKSTDPNRRKSNEDLRLQASIAQINRTIDNNPASELLKAGLYNASPMFSVNYHKPVAVQLAEKYGGKVTQKMVDNSLVRNIFSLQGSPVYKMSMSLATFNDFAAKYALYKHMQDKAQKDGKNFNMDKFIKRSDELFVNYNTPQPMLLDYLDNMGLWSFMKYFFGVQKGIYNSFKDHPVSMVAKIGGASMFGLHLPSILDSMISFDGVMNRFKMPGQMMADNIGSLPTEAVISSIM